MRILFIVLLFLSSNLFAADRYWVGGGSNSNWNAVAPTNWSATSGGANDASAPTSTDNVIFDANGNSSATANINVSILSLTVTSGYTSTITHNAVITIVTGGSLTLGANQTIAGASGLIVQGTVTLTSNGKAWPNTLTLQTASTTKTLADNWTVGILVATANQIQTLNGNTINVAGLTVTNSADILEGTTTIIMTGGTLGGNGTLRNNLTIAGNVSYSGLTLKYSTGTLTYSSGIFTAAPTSVLSITGTCTLNTAGIAWANITFGLASTYTITLTSLLTVTNTLTYVQASAVTLAGTHGFYAANVVMQQTAGLVITFANGVTYTITTSLDCRRSPFNPTHTSMVHFTSDHATNRAIITLQQGATSTVLAKFTRIDASNGRSINTFNGLVDDCLNVNAFTDLKTTSHNFIN